MRKFICRFNVNARKFENVEEIMEDGSREDRDAIHGMSPNEVEAFFLRRGMKVEADMEEFEGAAV